MLLYDIRRTATLAGPSAVYIDREAEKWLKARMAATEVAHVVHAPSNPPGWTAGKWGEWYPDVLDADKKLTIAQPKPYWQPGWLKQHDRLMAAMSAMNGRVPLVISGDMHAIALGKMLAQRHARSQAQSGQRRAVGHDRDLARRLAVQRHPRHAGHAIQGSRFRGDR